MKRERNMMQLVWSRGPCWVLLLCVFCSGCFAPSDHSPVWDYSQINSNIDTLRTATQSAPKQAIVMVAQELEESLKNHSRAAAGDVSQVLATLATLVSEFKQAVPNETKQQLLTRIEQMQQTLPAASSR
jgi:HPt (histidine-containing phosphotransfer) domain-containing protein